MKKIEKANIAAVYNNMLTKDLPIVSISLDYQGGCESQGTGGYTENRATSFINNLMSILDINDKSKLKGQVVSTCSEFYQLLAIGNESESQWIDLKNVDKIIKGNIIQYFEEKSKQIDDGSER